MLSSERANDVASTFKAKNIAYESGWASAIQVFSDVVKTQICRKCQRQNSLTLLMNCRRRDHSIELRDHQYYYMYVTLHHYYIYITLHHYAHTCTLITFTITMHTHTHTMLFFNVKMCTSCNITTMYNMQTHAYTGNSHPCITLLLCINMHTPYRVMLKNKIHVLFIHDTRAHLCVYNTLKVNEELMTTMQPKITVVFSLISIHTVHQVNNTIYMLLSLLVSLLA